MREMKKFSNNGKKIAAAVAAAVIAVSAVFGIGAAVRKTTSSAVPVIEVSSIDYGMWLDWENSVSGVITSEAEQEVYLSDTEKVKEVLVSEGQAVHKGDVLLKFDTKSTKLNLEKEKINREKILLDIEVAKTNIKTLDGISPVSDGDGMDFPDDFFEFETFEEQMAKAVIYKKILKADAKPANDDPEDETLGTEENPYIFLCEGDTVTISTDFIKKWQKTAKKLEMKQLYIALQKRDKAQKLQKSWMTDIMLLDPKYAIDVDMATGETSFAVINDEAKMAKLLRKILVEIPEDERAQWLAVMLDKLMVLTEKEEKAKERGQFLAAMLNELSKEDKDELAAAASHLDEETLSILFKNLTPEQIGKVEDEAVASLLTMLLENMTEEQIKALDADVLSAFLEKLTAEQLTSLSTETLCEVLSALNEEQLEAVIYGLSDQKRQEIMAILQKYAEEHKQEDGQDQQGGEGGQDQQGGEGGQDQQGGEGGQDQQGGEGGQDQQGGEGGQDQQGGEGGQDQQGGEGGQDQQGGNEDQGSQDTAPADSGTGNTEAAPSTAPAPSENNNNSGSSGGQLILSDAMYTSSELAQAKKDEQRKLKDLELDLKESDIKITQAQRAVDSGVVTATMNGVIRHAGDPASPPTDGSAFLVLAGADGLYVRSGVKESMLGQIAEGDMITVTSWQSGNQFEAQIGSISPYPDTTGMFDDGGNQTFYPFTASIMGENPGVENGEWVEVSYSLNKEEDSEENDNTQTVMKAFIREEDNRKYVYIRGEDGKLKKQYIVTGTLSDSGYEIISGLSSSDWIAFPYGKNVKEGARTREGTLTDLYGG